jgi:hypothetical protein
MRYRGLAKNTAQLFTLFGFANLLLTGRRFTISETRVCLERARARLSEPMYRIKAISGSADSALALVAESVCSKNGRGARNVN